MRYLITILLVVVGFIVNGQTRPSGFPAQYNTTWYRGGYNQADSGLIFAKRDTNWLPRFSGTGVWRPQNRRLYIYDSVELRWKKLLFEGETAAVTASNGLNIVGNDIRLGGTLTGATTITQGDHELQFKFNVDAPITEGYTAINSFGKKGLNILGDNQGTEIVGLHFTDPNTPSTTAKIFSSYGILNFSSYNGSNGAELYTGPDALKITVSRGAFSRGIDFTKILPDTGILVFDEIGNTGMYYGGDYSTNGIARHGNRWIPDLGAIQGLFFKQNGNSFGDTARLGTNDNFPVSIEINNSRKLTVTSSGIEIGGNTGGPAGIDLRGATPGVHIINGTKGIAFSLSNVPSQISYAFSSGFPTPASNPTSGNYLLMEVANGASTPFQPSSGNAQLTILSIAPSINQTGSANGITRGIYIAPTLTSAADFRALQIDTGFINTANGVLPIIGSIGGGYLIAYDPADLTWKRILPSSLPGGSGPTGSNFQLQYYNGGAFGANSKQRVNPTTGQMFSGKFEANDTTDAGTPNAAFLVNRSLTAEIAASGHGFRDQTIFNRPGFAYCAVDVFSQINGSGNHDHLIAFQGRPNYGSSGTLNDFYHGGASIGTMSGGGTITRAYGWDVWDITGTGTVVDNFGYHVQSLTKGTRNWAFYSEGTATPSLLRGSLGLGLATLTAPTERLDISGNIRMTGDIKFNTASNNNFIAPSVAKTSSYATIIQGNLNIDADVNGGAGIELHADNNTSLGGRINVFPYSVNADPFAGSVNFYRRSGVNTIARTLTIQGDGNVALNYNVTAAPFGLSINRSAGFNKDSTTIVGSVTSESILILDTITHRMKRVAVGNLPAGTPALPNTFIGVGNGSNLLSGSSAFINDGTSVKQENALASYSGTSTTILGSTSGFEFRGFAKATPTAADQLLAKFGGGSQEGATAGTIGASVRMYSTSAWSTNKQTYLAFYTTSTTAEAERMRVFHNGNVAIGLTSAKAWLTLAAPTGTNQSAINFTLTGATLPATPQGGSMNATTAGLFYDRADGAGNRRQIPLMNDVTPTAGGIIQGNGTDFTLLALGTPNQLLRVNAGATAAEWFTPSFVTSNIYTADGTVAGNRQVLGGGNSLQLGTTGSKLSTLTTNVSSAFIVNSDAKINLFGGIHYNNKKATDANYTLGSTDYSIRLPDITANRNLDLTLNVGDSGRIIVVHNQNTSANTWNLVDQIISAPGNAFAYLENNTIYTLQYTGIDGGSASWKVLSISGYTPLINSSAGTLTLRTSIYNRIEYAFTGTTTTWTLPIIGGVPNGFLISIKNIGSGNITLNSSGGGNDIYYTSATNSLTIAPNESYDLVFNGTYFLVK